MKISKVILLLLFLILIGCRNESFSSEEIQSNYYPTSKDRKSIISDTIQPNSEIPQSILEDDPKSPPRK